VIVWSRLGTALPLDHFPGPLSHGQVTGTEWEFEDALASRREREAPEVLVYRMRDAELSMKDSLAALEEQLGQKRLVEAFFERWFEGRPDGNVDLAVRGFRTTPEFELLIEERDTPVEKLMKAIPGPDFPTAGFIHGLEGIRLAYTTGRGIIQMRARAGIETTRRGEKQSIVVTELPYQVNKARLLEKIADLVREKKIEGISDLRDESDRDGIRVVMEVKKSDVPEILLNQLYKLSPMQQTFGVNMASSCSPSSTGSRRCSTSSRCCSTSSTTGRRSSSGGRATTSGRPRSGRTSSKGS